MALGGRVLYEGQFFIIVGEAVIEDKMDEETVMQRLLLAINKEEGGERASITRVTWVPIEKLKLTVSGLDYRDTEWFLGVQNGR